MQKENWHVQLQLDVYVFSAQRLWRAFEAEIFKETQ